MPETQCVPVSSFFYLKARNIRKVVLGYRASKHWKNPFLWRVIWRKYELDTKKGKYVAKERHIPENEYSRLGITKAMSLEEVQALLKKLNLEADRSQREDQRNVVQMRIDSEKEIECIHLPLPFVKKFESDHLATRYIGNEERLKKVLKLWRTSQKIIRTMTNPIEKWHRYPEHFYAHFERNSVSPGYAKNILSTVNMWLNFLGLEQEVNYRPIPPPNNTWQSRINTAFEEADKGKASLPITPSMLENVRNPFTQAQYNWIYCSIWAGLRPNEVNALINPKRTKIRYKGITPILEIYQSKLKNVPKIEDRWKDIPLFLPEQLKILEIIQSRIIEEPLTKTLANRFGERHTLYGGRKGFHDLFVTFYEQPELEVVRWLGHRSLDMAMKHYAKKDSVRWVPVNPLKKAS